MNIYLDVLKKIPYLDLPMKDIKYLLKQIDEQITTLQNKRVVLRQALEIQEQIDKAGSLEKFLKKRTGKQKKKKSE